MRVISLITVLFSSIFLMGSLAKMPETMKVKVAVIDTGLNLKDPRFKDVLCESGHKDFSGLGIEDTHGHGTHVAGLIKKTAGAGNYCLIIVKYYNDHVSAQINFQNSLKAHQWAVSQHVDYVNYSGGGEGFNEQEYLVYKSHPEITFVVAAGNDHKEMDTYGYHYYPAAYNLPNIVSVGNMSMSGVPSPSSNYGPKVKAWEFGEWVYSTFPKGNGFMSGTSQATAIHTGRMLKMRVP